MLRLLQQIAVFEGQGPVPAKLTLAEVVRAGKITNPYQTFVLGWLAEFFKNGCRSADLALEAPITFESRATSTELVNQIKALPPADHVALAQYLIDCIDAGDSALHDKTMEVSDWIKFVLKKQD